MANNECCEDTIGAFLGDGVNQGTYIQDPKVLIFQRRYKENGDPNSLDLTQSSFDTYFKGLIQTTTAEDELLYPTGKLDYVEVPDRTDFGSYNKTDGHTVILDSTGGIQSITFGFDGKRATFEKFRQMAKMDCNQWIVYIVDAQRLLAGFKDKDTDTTMRGFAISPESWDNMMKIGVGTDPSRVSATFEIEREDSFDCAYGIPSCEHNMSFSDMRPLNPGTARFISETSSTVIVISLRQAMGRATNANNKHFTGAATGTFTINPDGASAITATAVEDAGAETYTLTLASAMPSSTKCVGKVTGINNYGFNNFTFTSS